MKNTFKKKAAALLCAGALASGSAAVFADDMPVTVMYNGEPLTMTEAVAPEITDGRTMLPFRAICEGMGAVVDYDEETRTASAVMDDVKVSFVTGSKDINVTKDGKTEVLQSDVALYVKDGYTYVPVRFVSNALGMNIGWDGDTKTVYIVNKDLYFEELEKNCPNLMKLFATEAKQPEKYTDKVGIKFSLTVPQEEELGFTNLSADLALDAEGEKMDLQGALTAAISLDGPNIDEELKGVLSIISKGKLDCIFKDKVLYFKLTDMEELSKYFEETDDFKLNAWYKCDLNGLLEEYTQLTNVPVLDILENPEEYQSYDGFKTMLSAMVFDEKGDIIPGMETMMDMLIDTYKAVDSYIKVETAEDGTTTMTMDISTEQFKEMIKSMFPEEAMDEAFEQEMNAALEMLTLSATAAIKADASQSASVKLAVKGDGVAMELEISEDQTAVETITPIVVPEDAIDLTDTISQAFGYEPVSGADLAA